MKKVLFFTLFLFAWGAVNLNAQVTIGANTAPEKFSVLELAGNGTGLRLPQLSTFQRDSLSTTDTFTDNPKALGLMVFNTDTKCIDYWNGETWISQCAPTSIVLDCGGVIYPGSSIPVGSVPAEIVGAMPITGGTAPYTYEWQSCTGDPTAPENWTTAAGTHTNANYQSAALNNTTYFRRQVTDAVGATCFSNRVKIQVTLVAGHITQPNQLPLGGGTVTIDGTANTGGLISPVYHQWEYCTSGCDNEANWYSVTDNTGGYGTGGYACANDGTGLSYTTCNTTSDMQVRRRDMDGEQAQVTNTVLVTVKTGNPTGMATDINASYTGSAVCQDSPASFTVTLVPSVTSPVVIVYDSNGNEVSSKVNAPFTFTVNPGTAPETNYYVAFRGTNYDENLPADRKQVVIPVTAKQTPTISIGSDAANNSIMAGTSVTFTATATNLGGGTATYNWSVGGTSVQNGSSSTYTSTTLTNGAVVTCQLTLNGGCVTTATLTSNSLQMIVAQHIRSCSGCAALAGVLPISKQTYPYWGYWDQYSICSFDSMLTSQSGKTGPMDAVQYYWTSNTWRDPVSYQNVTHSTSSCSGAR